MYLSRYASRACFSEYAFTDLNIGNVNPLQQCMLLSINLFVHVPLDFFFLFHHFQFLKIR